MKTDILQDIANKLIELVRPSKIAEILKISPAEFEPLLAQAVVLGHIRRSDILFTFPQSVRDDVAVYHVEKGLPSTKLKHVVTLEPNLDDCEANFLCALVKQRVVYSDLYDMLSEIETTLHDRIRQCLKREFRKSPDDAWWNKGVPLAVRKSCAAKREEDENPADGLYSYTTLIELKATIEGSGQWKYFEKRLPTGAQNKPQLLSKLSQLNLLRNRVMHPVRRDTPLGEVDYRFVSEIHNTLVTSPWNLGPGQK